MWHLQYLKPLALIIKHACAVLMQNTFIIYNPKKRKLVYNKAHLDSQARKKKSIMPFKKQNARGYAFNYAPKQKHRQCDTDDRGEDEKPKHRKSNLGIF